MDCLRIPVLDAGQQPGEGSPLMVEDALRKGAGQDRMALPLFATRLK